MILSKSYPRTGDSVKKEPFHESGTWKLNGHLLGGFRSETWYRAAAHARRGVVLEKMVEPRVLKADQLLKTFTFLLDPRSRCFFFQE
jgi:hypothetical protein